MYLCPGAVWCPAARVFKRWWEKEGINMSGVQKATGVEETETNLG